MYLCIWSTQERMYSDFSLSAKQYSVWLDIGAFLLQLRGRLTHSAEMLFNMLFILLLFFLFNRHRRSLLRFGKCTVSSLIPSLGISRAYCFKMLARTLRHLSCSSRPCSFWWNLGVEIYTPHVLVYLSLCALKAIADLRVQILHLDLGNSHLLHDT